MNLVAEYCSSVAVFKDGKILAQGTPKQIFSDGAIIAESGLDLPLTASLTQKLKEKGIFVESDLTVKGFTDAVYGAFTGGKR